jgi:transcriptional regulator with XRE-family HTH domain
VSDDIRLGRIVRDVRLSRHLRQQDVAARAGTCRQIVSRLECGSVDRITVGVLRAISSAMGMPSLVTLGWHGPEVERLRDRLHAALGERVAADLRAAGWQVIAEYSFSHYGERGSVDVLAWRPEFGALLEVEVKTRLWDLQETLSALDRKRRLVPKLVERERHWRARSVGVILVMPELSTHRHTIERHSNTFAAALPDRQAEVRRWLVSPDRDLRGIWFLPIALREDIGQRSFRRRASRKVKRGPK